MADAPPPPRHVLVTGAARGIGRAIAAGFVAAGELVTVLGRKPESSERARSELGAAHAVAADVSDAAALERALKDAAAAGGMYTRSSHSSNSDDRWRSATSPRI